MIPPEDRPATLPRVLQDLIGFQIVRPKTLRCNTLDIIVGYNRETGGEIRSERGAQPRA